jgi:hypothetical protein
MNDITLEQIGYILLILFIHYVADFIFQNERWAQAKSYDFDQLLNHTMVYSMFWAACGSIFILIRMFYYNDSPETYRVMWLLNFLYTMITFVVHTATDYISSKPVKQYFIDKKYGSAIPNWGAFSAIGLDQWVHYVQIFLTIWFVFQLI